MCKKIPPHGFMHSDLIQVLPFFCLMFLLLYQRLLWQFDEGVESGEFEFFMLFVQSEAVIFLFSWLMPFRNSTHQTLTKQYT